MRASRSPRLYQLVRPRTWSVGEILTAANKNTYERTVLEDLAGRNGPVEYEGAIVIDSLTTTERDAITLTGTGGLGASGNGLVIYNSTKSLFERYENGAWREFTDLAALTISGAAQGDIFFRGATAIQRLAAGTTRQLFRTGGSGANPSWNDLEGTKMVSTTTRGSVIYEDTNGRIARLTPSTVAGWVLESAGTNADPTWGPKGTFYDVFSTTGSFTWTPKGGVRFIYVESIGGGGGGGSGGRNSTNNGTVNGGAGGVGASWSRSGILFQELDLPATITGTIGAGGAGGAAVTTGTSAGNAGATGGASSFGAAAARWYQTAAGGTGGAGGGDLILQVRGLAQLGLPRFLQVRLQKQLAVGMEVVRLASLAQVTYRTTGVLVALAQVVLPAVRAGLRQRRLAGMVA